MLPVTLDLKSNIETKFGVILVPSYLKTWPAAVGAALTVLPLIPVTLKTPALDKAMSPDGVTEVATFEPLPTQIFAEVKTLVSLLVKLFQSASAK